MEVTLSDDAVPSTPPAQQFPVGEVTLADGTTRDICALREHERVALQWEQERAFARRILDAPKGSPERAEAVQQAYDNVPKIVAAATCGSGQPSGMGVHPRYGRLVVKLLSRWRARGQQPRFFEIGYGCGTLLKYVCDHGFPVSGIEVSPVMYERACRLLGAGHAQQLLIGDLIRCRFSGREPRYSLIYWNDVFEHIPPDEISDYLDRIHDLLVPGGQLITITPNWHSRPWDVTGNVCPPRTEAVGLHLKEYTLREVTGLLRRAGFRRVATPLVVTPHKTVLWRGGLAGPKRLLERSLEWLPFCLANLCCRGFGLSCTIATKVD